MRNLRQIKNVVYFIHKCYLYYTGRWSSQLTMIFRDKDLSHGCRYHHSVSSVQSLIHVQLFATPWIAACQASLSITNFQSSLRLTSIESVMPSSHLILCRPLLLLPSIPPSIRVFSNESALLMRCPLPFLNPAWTSESSRFTYCWSLAWSTLILVISTSLNLYSDVLRTPHKVTIW